MENRGVITLTVSEKETKKSVEELERDLQRAEHIICGAFNVEVKDKNKVKCAACSSAQLGGSSGVIGDIDDVHECCEENISFYSETDVKPDRDSISLDDAEFLESVDCNIKITWYSLRDYYRGNFSRYEERIYKNMRAYYIQGARMVCYMDDCEGSVKATSGVLSDFRNGVLSFESDVFIF